MKLTKLLERWQSDLDINSCIEEWKVLPAKPAQTVPFPDDVLAELASLLQQNGIHSLYTHQETTWKHIQQGRNVVVVTGTSSGKTLCYNLPILDRLMRDAQARAMYFYPTKALAQDQLTTLRKLLTARSEQANPELPGVPPASIPIAVYDGDTPTNARPAIRKTAQLVISNPDMIHTGILPHHTAWVDFFRNLQFIVIDEIHTYRGVFGSHVANLIRRIKRLCLFYGAKPQFILTSATIANPTELAEWLIEEPVSFVDNDGSAKGPKHFLVYNPPIVDRKIGLRRGVLQESIRFADDLLSYGVQTIVFGRSRRTVEMILSYLKQLTVEPSISSGQEAIPIQTDVRGYRSGYLPKARREIEQGLKSGNIQAVIATNALELGIDIGGMGAAILVGYPGSIAATWQQAGRAGRQTDTSLALLILSPDPLDQYLARHPNYIFEHAPEQALINPDNLLILLQHIRCAAFELPFHPGERFGRVDPDQLQEFLEYLRAEGVLHLSQGKYFWMANRYPAEAVSLRSTSAEIVTLHADQNGSSSVIGQIDMISAYWMVHPEAIYLHEAKSYLVEELDLENKIAHLKAVDYDYYTEPRLKTTVKLLEKHAEVEVRGGVKAHGDISVTTQVVGFRKMKWYTNEMLGYGEVYLPPVDLITTGYWLTLSDEVVEHLRSEGLWLNDPNDYGPEWPSLRRQVRLRDGYCCKVCGTP